MKHMVARYVVEVYACDEMALELCRGAAAANLSSFKRAGDDPAPDSASLPSLAMSDAEHGGGGALPSVVAESQSPAVPLPLQPFVDAGMNRKNIQAAFSFLQAELEKALGDEGTKTFRRLWLQLPGIFKSREEAKAQTIATWCKMWAHVEAARERRAA